MLAHLFSCKVESNFEVFLNFVRTMNEVISPNVVFLNLFQRKLIHVPIGVRYI